MKKVEPEIHLIAKTKVDQTKVNDWLSSKGVSSDAISTLSESAKTFGTELVALCAKRCYMSYEPKLNPNVERVRNDMSEFIENILTVGHGSVLEHVNYTFAIENVSRVFTGEINRHRAGVAISEGSMRFIRYYDIPYWVPTSIQEKQDEDEDDTVTKEWIWDWMCNALSQESIMPFFRHHDFAHSGNMHLLEKKKLASRLVFEDVFEYVEKCYLLLQSIWSEELAPNSKFAAKKQITSMMRRIIPMGVATGGTWTLNLRALRHVFTMRCSPAAEEEILLVASMMLEKMIETEPDFFGDFKKVDGYWKPKFVKV